MSPLHGVSLCEYLTDSGVSPYKRLRMLIGRENHLPYNPAMKPESVSYLL
jgi:hypothetical protein